MLHSRVNRKSDWFEIKIEKNKWIRWVFCFFDTLARRVWWRWRSFRVKSTKLVMYLLLTRCIYILKLKNVCLSHSSTSKHKEFLYSNINRLMVLEIRNWILQFFFSCRFHVSSLVFFEVKCENRGFNEFIILMFLDYFW